MRNNCTYAIAEECSRNFDLSIIMPFYKKMQEFRKVFPQNRRYVERNGIEVVVVLDAPDERDELLEYIKQYPFVNWRIVMNDKPHGWRNPAKPLNVGIRHASKKYVLVCSPESEMLTDVPLILRKTFEDYPHYPHYAIGRVCFADDEQVSEKTFDSFKNIPFGSIMFERAHAEQIHGYDETFSKWGGDDNNFRSRLDMNGIGELYINEAMMVHRDIGTEGKERRSVPFEKTPNDVLRHYFFPDKAVANDESWGQDFGNVIFDWKHDPLAERRLREYLKTGFPKNCVKKGYAENRYPLLLLVQSYNERERIMHFLKKASPLFDGIILLDDGSTDGTYEAAEDNKLIAKVQKNRTCFNDLENRNLLMDLSSFVDFTLAVFLDVDEEFDERFCDLRQYLGDTGTNAYSVPYIHLWNQKETYNADYPSGVNGICLRYKMFRNIGHARIFSNRGKLHFHQAPTIGKSRIADNLLIKHSGLLYAGDRAAKYSFYKAEDTENSQSSYEHFKATPRLQYVDNITSDDLTGFAVSTLKRCHL